MRGLLGAAHALEIPFVFGTFNNAAVKSSNQAAAPVAVPDPKLSRFAGSGPAVERLGAEMQQAWLTFARTGATLSSWRSYDKDTRATMVFDGGGSRVMSDPMAAERLAVDAVIGEARRGAVLGL